MFLECLEEGILLQPGSQDLSCNFIYSLGFPPLGRKRVAFLAVGLRGWREDSVSPDWNGAASWGSGPAEERLCACPGRISGLHCHAVSVLGWMLVLGTGNRTEPCVWQEKQLCAEAMMQRRVLKGELLRALQNL